MVLKRVFCIGNGESRKGFDLETLRKHGTIYGCNALYRDFMPDVLTAVDHGIMHEIYHAGMAQKIPCYFRDWTKVPAMMYDHVIKSGITDEDFELIKSKNGIKENDRGDCKEFVYHGAALKGTVNVIKKDGDLSKTNINLSQMKISWIPEVDYSHSLTDICVENNGKGERRDFGWACGASAGYVAIHREQPTEIYMIGHDLHSHNNKINNLYKSTTNYTSAENGPTPAVNWIKQWKTLFDWYPNIKFYKINRFNDSRDMVNGPIKEWSNNKNLIYADYSTLDNLA